MSDLLYWEDVDRAEEAVQREEEQELRERLRRAELLIEDMESHGETPFLLARFRERAAGYRERLAQIGVAA